MAMLTKRPMRLSHILSCDDTAATLASFQALGGEFIWQDQDLYINGENLWQISPQILDVKASASTLRFMIPICLTHPGTYHFVMEESLSRRSLSSYQSLFSNQVHFKKDGQFLTICGGIKAGDYEVDGSISSQFISGLLMALPLVEGKSTLHIKNQIVSKDYIEMTLDVLRAAGIQIHRLAEDYYEIAGNQNYCFEDVAWQPDASSAAFFEIAKYLGHALTIENSHYQHQADANIKDILKKIALQDLIVDVADMPDIVPALSLAMTLSGHHYEIINASRLRDKECDRLKAVAQVLSKMGADIQETRDGLIIQGVPQLHGASVDSWHDHRIAMMTAIAASVASEPVILYDGDCVSKSWPDFFKIYASLGGKYDELSLRE